MDLPCRLGPFLLTRRIGSGGMGVVYQGVVHQDVGHQDVGHQDVVNHGVGHHGPTGLGPLAKGTADDGVTPGTAVAVKVVRTEFRDDLEFRARFRREVELVRRVAGVCTARVVAADPDGDPPYLATEYLAGPSLADYVKTRGVLTGVALRTLAVGLAEALVAVHAAGVVHRDLKPSNVLLTWHGPKVIDFGIAQAVDSTSLTRTGAVLGSPAFMAPEQVAGAANGPAIDVFAWASTVVFAATGLSPFGYGPTDAVLFRIRHDPPNLDGVPADLRGPVARALTKDPRQRPNAWELLGTMLAVAGGRVGNLTDNDGVDEPSAEVTRLLAESWPIARELPFDDGSASEGALVEVAPDAAPPTPAAPAGMSRAPAGIASAGGIASPAGIASAGGVTPPTPRDRSIGGGRSRIAIAVTVITAALLAAVVVVLSPWQADGPPQASASPSPSVDSASAPATATATVTAPATDAVVADRLSYGVRLFMDALGDNFKAWSLDVHELVTGTDGPAFEAPILGAWWSLADWCVAHQDGTVGQCYDLASEYVKYWFDTDPRTINTETWAGAGAVGGLLFDGYDASQVNLGLPPSSQSIPVLTANRPGTDVLCEPTCAARL